MKRMLAAAAALMGAASMAQATPVDPTFDSFGALPGATWGGTGIDNSSVAITVFEVGAEDSVTLGLSAHARYDGTLTNDGAGTFRAQGGLDTPPGAPNPGALWNFNFYAGASEGVRLDDYQIDLYYDFDPAENTARADLGRWDLTALLAAIEADPESGISDIPPGFVLQTSQNLAFSFLSDPVSAGLGSLITPPSASFDPFAGGEYAFELVLADGHGGEATSAMLVEVEAVPLPAAAPLTLLGVGAIAWLGRRRARG
jgi:hypothetical protein